MLEVLNDREIYEKVILNIPKLTSKYLWIATADIKDMYMHSKSGKMLPFLEILNELVIKRVEIRLLHAKEPGNNFRKDFDKYPQLWKSMERMLCPRVHFKTIIIDGEYAYSGSANLTGAGMGAKSKSRRNFENGIWTSEYGIIEKFMSQFDNVWMGLHCKECGRIDFCKDRIV